MCVQKKRKVSRAKADKARTIHGIRIFFLKICGFAIDKPSFETLRK